MENLVIRKFEAHFKQIGCKVIFEQEKSKLDIFLSIPIGEAGFLIVFKQNFVVENKDIKFKVKSRKQIILKKKKELRFDLELSALISQETPTFRPSRQPIRRKQMSLWRYFLFSHRFLIQTKMV